MTEPGPLADVDAAAEQADGAWSLVFVRDLRHAPDEVWAALTEPARLRAWAPFVPDRNRLGDGPARVRRC